MYSSWIFLHLEMNLIFVLAVPAALLICSKFLERMVHSLSSWFGFESAWYAARYDYSLKTLSCDMLSYQTICTSLFIGTISEISKCISVYLSIQLSRPGNSAFFCLVGCSHTQLMWIRTHSVSSSITGKCRSFHIHSRTWHHMSAAIHIVLQSLLALSQFPAANR